MKKSFTWESVVLEKIFRHRHTSQHTPLGVLRGYRITDLGDAQSCAE